MPLCAAPNVKHELAMTKLQLEAERNMARLREETISILKSDKEHLQQELSRKEELVKELVKNRSLDPPSSSGDKLQQFVSVAALILYFILLNSFSYIFAAPLLLLFGGMQLGHMSNRPLFSLRYVILLKGTPAGKPCVN